MPKCLLGHMIEHYYPLLSSPWSSKTAYKAKKNFGDKDADSVLKFVSRKNRNFSKFYMIGGGVTKNRK
jgi:hypothetical protein